MASPQKTNPPPKRSSLPKKKGQHKKPTREKILEAATEVFADYPYHGASIRMIGKTAGIDHPLINYYFPTKAALFEEVLKISTEKYYIANISWFDGLTKLGPEKGLALYIDRFLDFAQRHPKVQRIITLNLVPAEQSDIIPGYQLIQNFFEKTTLTFTKAIPLKGSKHNIEMLITSFNTLAVNYLGARTYYAGILGMDPASRQYMDWVKDSLIYMILPRLRQLLGEAVL
ncbi:MAG: TetR/AcrR family transcriptional regulator [Desulfobacteraceae bacterium]|jgi:TetR/AcrR family transcriptional regulator|nr:TetR/AcrR family transcriptional regulator [Desulfobacteraceae bacterium]